PKPFDHEYTAKSLYLDKKGGKHLAKAPSGSRGGQKPSKVSTSRGSSSIIGILVEEREKLAVGTIARVSFHRDSPASRPTQAAWTPAVHKTVTFQFADPAGNLIGTLDGGPGPVQAQTDQSGIATVTFKGNANGQVRIIGKVLLESGETCTPPEVYWDIEVGGQGFFKISHLLVIG